MESINNTIEDLIYCKKTSDKTSSLTPKQVEGALRTLFKKGDYDNFELLGAGSNGIIVGSMNSRYKRESALKICLCKSRAEVFRLIAIL